MSAPLQTRVLALLDYYLPGFKSGGPLRSVANLVGQTGGVLEFHILTRDRDATETTSYPGVKVGEWNDVAGAKVRYTAPEDLGLGVIRRVAHEVRPDVVYLNSFFSGLTIRYLLLRRLGWVPRVPVVIAPRGELSPGALSIKRTKKRAFLFVAEKLLGLYRGLRWQATAELERAEIAQGFPAFSDVRVAPNLAGRPEGAARATPPKSPGAMRLVFCSRITPKKNLHAIFGPLAAVGGQASLALIGPVRDHAYWEQCRAQIAALPATIRVEHRGEIPHEQIAAELAGHHFFILPTLGENFGHAIIEALVAGCPVLISDQTPWHDVPAAGAGWVLPVDDAAAWQRALAEALAMDEADYRAISARAREYGRRHLAAPPVEASVALFRDVR